MPKTNIDCIACDGWRAEVTWRPDEYECPCGATWLNGPGVPSYCAECGTEVVSVPGHVQVASVNPDSPFAFPAEPGDPTHDPDGDAARFTGWWITLDADGIDRMVGALMRARRAAYPAAGAVRSLMVTHSPTTRE